MVNKCAAYGCRSGYMSSDGSTNNDLHVTFHAFPLNDKALCDKWVRANPRKDFVPTKYSRICSLHFKPSDFITEHQDSNKQRTKTYSDDRLVRRYLKKGTVPSIFPNAPVSLSRASATPRTTNKATSSSRQQNEAEELSCLEQSFMAEDDISQLTTAELADRLQSETSIPQGFIRLLVDQTLYIYMLQVTENVPKIRACITVNGDLSVLVTVDDKVIPASQFKDLVKGPMKRMSQLINLMARIKSSSEDMQTRSFELLQQMAMQCLKDAVATLDNDDDDKRRRITFIMEQLQQGM